MRLLVVSDIHGNWPALQAIRDIEKTVAGIRRMPLAEEAAEALIAILRTGRPDG